MKYYNRILLLAMVAGITVSCADALFADYKTEKPESLKKYEYLNEYGDLKTYIDRISHPDFKLGTGVTVSDFLKQDLVYTLTVNNYDDVTAGNAMKYSSCVDAKGNMDFGTVKKFVKTAKETGLQIYFTCPYADIRLIKENTENLIVCAQSMDPLTPGRGMGHVLPESLKEAGAEAVFLNHAENPKTVSDLYATIKRAKELGMITIVCADSTVEAKAVACMDPDIVLAEPTDLIGTGKVADDSYTIETVKGLHEVNPNVLVMIASGVSTADDCYNVVKLGADGTGATSGILNAPSPAQRVHEMAEAIVKAKKEK